MRASAPIGDGLARPQGYRFAVLFSSRMAYSLYQQLGFREVTGKIGIYVMEKD
jgi:hypothetical protein